MNKNDPLISVVIPVYNTAGYLGRCLDSILNGTYENLEVLCVNDGSTDNSLQILNTYAAADPRVHVIDKPTGGVSAARNDAIAQAAGEYLLFIDSDDWVHPQYFSLLLHAVTAGKTDLAACELFKTGTYAADFKAFDEASLTLAAADVFSAPQMRYTTGMIYPTALVKRYRFPEKIAVAEDTFYNTVVLTGELDAGRRLTLTVFSEPLYFYYQRETSALHVLSHATGQLRAAEAYLDLAETMQTDEARAILIERAYKASLLSRYLNRYTDAYAETKAKAKGINRRAAQMRRGNACFSSKKKVFYSLSAACPSVYRLYRIVTDPTMLQWEKQQKANRKQPNRRA